MKTAAEKSSVTASRSSHQSQPFFGKAGEGDFFAPAVQAKLTVGKPGDKFEQEADAMADKVVRRSETPDVQGKCAGCEEKDKMQRKPLAERITPFVQRKETKETPAPAMPKEEEKPVQKAEEKEEAAQAKFIQRAAEKEEEKPVQKAEEKEEAAQAKFIQRAEEKEEPMQKAEEKEEAAQAKLIQRMGEKEEEKPVQKAEEKEETAQAKFIQRAEEKEEPVQKAEEKEEAAQAKSSDGVVPQASSSVEGSLAATKGGGSPLSDDTKASMESGFGVDFSGVRIHTDSAATGMSKDLHAQAFTHGNDIYFNEGKYNPATSEGKTLLAHELTHTVQQGASIRQKPEPAVAPSPILQREAEIDPEMQKELEAADQAQKDAIDPAPAQKARANAEQVIEVAEQKARQKHGKKKGGKSKKGGKKGGVGSSKKGKAAAQAAKEAEFKKNLGDVGKDLSEASAFSCAQATDKSQNLAENEQTHDDAAQKQGQTEVAVVPPPEEGQAMSNTEQVGGLDAAEPPKPDKEAARRTMTNSLAQAMPRDIEEVNAFSSEGKAKVVGSDILGTVTEDVTEVQDKYNDIEQPLAPKPSPEPVELPPTEVAPPTSRLNLGKGAVPALKPEHTDVKEFDTKSDDLLTEEGITQEQLDWVDKGDLAEANKERKGLKQKVAEEPAKIQQFATQQTQQVEKNLQQEEAAGKSKMKQKRGKGLNDTREKQKKTKSDIEIKREAVTKHINSIYETAKNSVTAKLANLEKQSLKTFDEGQAKASTEFEQDVKYDIDVWKSERYSGLFGGAKWLKDKFVGIDHFPAVQKALSDGKSNFIRKVDALIVKIDADNQKVIQGCKQELADARIKIENYVKTLKPELAAAGKAAQKEMQTKLDETDKFIDQQKDKLREKLCSKREEAIKDIDKKIEKMKEEMSGLLSKLGNLILNAMIKLFEWALEAAGFNPTQIMDIINKGKAIIKKIVTDPIGFFKNIGKAVGKGIQNFADNIKKHLIAGIMGWLTGTMSDSGLQLPATWDLKGIIFLVLQILNLSKEAIFKKLYEKVGRPIVDTAIKAGGIVTKLFKEGPMALWEDLKEKGEEIKEKMMEATRNWVAVEMVKAGVLKLISMLNPVGAFVQAILAIYNTVMFFVENWDRIVSFVKTVFSAIADIAMGRLGAAIAAVEKALALTIPIILAFIARILGLSGIGKAIRTAIEKVRAPIDKVIDLALNKIVVPLVKKATKMAKKGKEKAKAAAKKILDWLKIKRKYSTTSGESHSLHFKMKGKAPNLMVASTPEHISDYLSRKKGELNSAGSTISVDEKTKLLASISEAETIVNDINALTYPTNPPKETTGILEKKVNSKMTALSNVMKKIDINAKPVPPFSVIPGFSTNKANGLKVRHLLQGHHEPGSEASEYAGDLHGAIVVLKSLNIRPKWVAFHLLNNNTGGKAIDSNLVPVPQFQNKQFTNAFENSWKAKYRSNGVLWMDASLSYRNSLFLKKVNISGGEMAYNKKQKKWAEDKSKSISPWNETIPPPEPEALLINQLPGDEGILGEIAQLIPIEKNKLVLISKIKPNVVTSKEQLIRIAESALSNDEINRNKLIKQIKSTPMDFSF